MEEKWQIIIEYFFSGNNPNYWILSKFIAAFIGGIGAWLAKNRFFTAPEDTRFNFFWRGFIFSFFGAVGGICFLNPPTAGNAFATGLIGVAAITAFIKQNNTGLSETEYENKHLNKKEIERKYKGE